MISEIKNIDISLENLVSSLNLEARKLEFNKVCEFKLNKYNIPEIPWGQLNYPGVYLIEIKNNYAFNSFPLWLENFKNRWEDEKYLKSFTPNLKKKRIKEQEKIGLGEWVPLYIGKSKKIEGRIHEHIFKELHKTTFALKLNARENLKDETFRLSTIKYDATHYNIIMPIIEYQQRDKVNPLIGRQ